MREVKVVFDVPGVTVAVSVQKRNDKNKGAYICHNIYEVGDDENDKTNLFSLPLSTTKTAILRHLLRRRRLRPALPL